MRYLTLVIIVVFAFTLKVQGQRWTRERHHMIVGLGASGFMGELGGADQVGTHGMRDFDFAAIRPAVTLGYRYLLLENLGITSNLSFGYIAGNDKNTDEPFRNNRNIHFRSPILELSAKAQWHFYSTERAGARYRAITRVRGRGSIGYSFYAFGGVAGFYFNPQGYFDGQAYSGSVITDELPANGWYNLRPLRTEGQGYFPTRKKYSPVSFAIPFGLGAMFRFNQDISLSVEYGFRKTFTDYIDDVSTTYVDPAVFQEIFPGDNHSIALAEYFANPTLNNLSEKVTEPGQQRGSPYNYDAYMFSFITLYYRIPETRRRYGIPRF